MTIGFCSVGQFLTHVLLVVIFAGAAALASPYVLHYLFPRRYPFVHRVSVEHAITSGLLEGFPISAVLCFRIFGGFS